MNVKNVNIAQKRKYTIRCLTTQLVMFGNQYYQHILIERGVKSQFENI